jgi:hypothetical protein
MPSGRLLQRWPAPSLTDADRVWCMYAFVALVYGLLLPLLLLFIKEVHFRGEARSSYNMQQCLLCCLRMLTDLLADMRRFSRHVILVVLNIFVLCNALHQSFARHKICSTHTASCRQCFSS